MLHDNGLPGLIISFVAASGLAFGFVTIEGQQFKLIWWVVMMMILTFRMFDTILWRKHKSAAHYSGQQAIKRYISGTLVTAVLWATYCVVVGKYASNLELTFMIIIVSAMAGGSATVLAPHTFTAVIYSAIMLVPFSVLLLLSPENHKYVLGLLGVSFAAVMMFSAKKASEFTLQAIRLKNQNAVLVNHMEDEVAQRTQQIYELSNIDPLTRLFNRTAFLINLKQQLALCQRQNRQLALLFLDLDGFKKINDSIGHETGDMVLKITAERLQHHCPDNKLLCRWGGDEFLIALPCDDKAEAGELAIQLIEAICGPYAFENNRLSIGATIGIAMYPEHAGDESTLIQLADTAMYYQKKIAPCSVGYFTANLSRQLIREQRLKDGLAQAIDNQQLSLVFQPIVDAQNQQPVAFEALLRWTLDTAEVSPAEFIPIAEQYGLIRKIGTWVLEQACCAAMTWPVDLSVSVNVSVIQLQDDDFIDIVKQALSQSGLAARRLHIEITESVFAADKRVLLYRVKALQQMDIDVSIDDFGTEYSSLSVVQELSANIVKIDRSFIRTLESNGLPIVKAVLNIAKAFNYKVVAEGVEVKEQASMLKYLGVDYLQGFYFAKPLTGNELQDYLFVHFPNDVENQA